MEAIKHYIRTPENHQFLINIPPYVPENEVIEVILILKRRPSDYEQKINAMKKAMSDSVFLSDLEEVHADFAAIDAENWEAA